MERKNKILYLMIVISCMLAIYSYIDTKNYSAAKNNPTFIKPPEDRQEEQLKDVGVSTALEEREKKQELNNLLVFDIPSDSKQKNKAGVSKQNAQSTKITKEEINSVIKTEPVVKKEPIKLEFPNKKKVAPIKPVSLTDNGEMDVIEEAKAIGWYKYGSIPGQEGNALLNGHRDWKGELGTLWKLESFETGELMVVYFDDGSEEMFALDSLEVYPMDFVPDKYMELGGESRTTLISCAGTFKNGGYQDRVIAVFKKI